MTLIELKAKKLALEKELSRTANEIRFHEAKPNITAHALLRYIERHLEIDTNVLKKQILNDDVISLINSGAKKIKYDGMELRIDNKTIVTII